MSSWLNRSASFCALLSAAACLAAPPIYRITDVRGLPPPFDWQFVTDINKNGDVAGYVFDGDTAHVWIWKADTGTVNDFGPAPEGGAWANTARMNDAGQVVAAYGAPELGRTVVKTVVLALGAEPIVAPRSANGRFIWGIDIDNDGRVIGDSQPTDGIYSWKPGEIPVRRTRKPGVVVAMDDHGRIAGGTTFFSARERPFIASANGHAHLLDPDPSVGGRATAINNLGHACGWRTVDGVTHPFFWSREAGMVDIAMPEGTDGFCRGLNDAGEAVGWSTSDEFPSFYWTAASGPIKLFDLIDPDDPLKPNYRAGMPVGINQSGQILLNAGPEDWQKGSAYLVLTPQRSPARR